MSHQDLPSIPPYRFRPQAKRQKEQSLTFFALFLLAFLIALGGLVAGFIYGDSYGRRHAQYDNPVLREYYSGQCYAYWETQFSKTVRQALTKPSNNAEQTLRLDEIRGLLLDMQTNLAQIAAEKETKGKKKSLSSNSGLSSRLIP